MRCLFYVILLLMCFVSCKTQKFTPYDYEGDIVHFGSGGGFANQMTQYTILYNGQFFSGTNNEGFVDELKTLKKEVVQQLFKNLDRFELDKTKFNQPGNRYYFIKYEKNGVENFVQWGNEKSKPQKEVLLLFANLKQLVKSQNQ